MALSKPLSDLSAGNAGGTSAWFAPAGEWSLLAVCDHLQLGCRELHLGAGRVKVKEPLLELSDDLIDFSFSIGRCIASPMVDLAAYATGSVGASDRQDVLMLSPSKLSLACNSSTGCSSILASRKEVDLLGKDGAVLSLIIAGVLSPGPSGVLVLASIGPAFSVKAACAFVGTCMLWKCWTVYTRRDDGVSEQNKQRRDLAIVVSGVCGIVNLSLAFGGLPALLKLGGISLHLTHYVTHPDIFLHYLADVVLCPLLIWNMGSSPQVKQMHQRITASPQVDTLAMLMPSMAASSIGACCMVGTSLTMSPLLIYSCLGANACCVVFQNLELQALFHPNPRTKKTCDAYIFSQALYPVPTLLAVVWPSKTMVACLPLIDMFGKMGVLQLTQNDGDTPVAPTAEG